MSCGHHPCGTDKTSATDELTWYVQTNLNSMREIESQCEMYVYYIYIKLRRTELDLGQEPKTSYTILLLFVVFTGECNLATFR